MLERLFAAYFKLGEDIGCPATLIAIARSAGFDADAVSDCLLGDGSRFDEVPEATRGVPGFLFNRQLTVVGAQPAEALLGAMCEALHEHARECDPA